ncbi:phosphoketolase family protein [Hymenobacter rubripertinctus]
MQEGSEPGYSLSHAFGAVFDNFDLIVACGNSLKKTRSSWPMLSAHC